MRNEEALIHCVNGEKGLLAFVPEFQKREPPRIRLIVGAVLGLTGLIVLVSARALAAIITNF